MRAFHHRYTWNDYLLLARSSNIKLEFFDGEIFAMAGGTPEHSALAMAVGIVLGGQLEGQACRVYNSDLRVRVLATGLGTYPDVTVVCGSPEYDPDDRDTVVNPSVLVEVLSNTTEEYDRGKKFDNYQKIPSLKEYVLVSQRERLIEVFRRGPGNEWSRVEARTHAAILLESIRCELQVDRIYAGLDLSRGS